jgi:hypothetical protein
MADYQDLLFSRAFLVVPGPQYNEVSQRLRESQDLFFYEVILPPDAPWEFMRDRVCPSLARFLKSKSLDPEMGIGVVVSLFFQERFYLLKGPEFMKSYAEIEGLDPNAFHSRVLEWLSEPEKQEGTEEKDNFRPDLPAVRK